MTERSIIMTAASVQAILAGTKTQTRRVLRPQPDVLRAEVSPTGAPTLAVQWRGTRWESSGGRAVTLANLWESWAAWRCPYGISALYQDPPDRLWVREKWTLVDGEVWHYATTEDPDRREDGAVRWCSPLHMPRWAARLTLEVVAVRVERLQAITDAEALAEGIWDRQAFAREWDALNARRGFAWETNPWVWTIEFRRTE